VALILNIHTAVQTASVCLARQEELLELKINPSQTDHAGWIQDAICDMLVQKGLKPRDLEAVAVSLGPGSYTGLRVGMASAKGLCYALNIPLITINTLKIMAVSAMNETKKLMCPMIDARRMEVFAAVYDQQLNEIIAPLNLVLDDHSFHQLLSGTSVCFFGNGSKKFHQICMNPNAEFKDVDYSAQHMISLSYKQFSERVFTNLAYSEPFYGKDFYSTFK
jgi:tRNA threonylcarbamoyladenosine biosynthesis protein TsaB